MPRPQKCRRICALPGNRSFGPADNAAGEVVMAMDEFESIRLIDRAGCTQEECAAQMGVARTTVQALYTAARRKLAEALVDGKRLVIRGGNVMLCPQSGACCGKRCARECKGGVLCENCSDN